MLLAIGIFFLASGLLPPVSGLLAAEPRQVQVTTLDGQIAVGALVELGDRQLVIETAGAKQTFESADVRMIGPADDKGASKSAAGLLGERRPTVWLETIDGSRIPAVGYSVTKGTAELKLADGEALSLPTNSIRLVEFPTADGAAASWVGELRSDLDADLIVVRKREGIDYVEGAAGDVSDEIVNFDVDKENIPVKRAKVAGIVYFHRPDSAGLPQPNCVFDDAAGGRMKAKSVTLADGQFKIAATFGGSLTRPVESLKLLDFSPGKMAYLSDLAPISSDWTPFVDFGKEAESLARFYRPQIDRGLDNGALRLAGKTYPKGLSIPSRTALIYKITGKGKRFKALAGIDDGVRQAGSVHLVIGGDGNVLYEGKISGRNPPVELDLDIAGVKRLNILVDFGEGLDVGNYLDLCDARIVK
ncbi:MAG TPA: NPCBM/NEW2 domain-containing protein [Pirellulales bacterium]|nr:NPCBM/NEW2 domain-containing protein [Pirellulales bacterium]